MSEGGTTHCPAASRGTGEDGSGGGARGVPCVTVHMYSLCTTNMCSCVTMFLYMVCETCGVHAM